eukprot:TRINITY_DN227_c0_g2_i1.p1 TRINITY_DN227_c0_g2~~TRINITY_DN227_c0_g2_i1.p1  ORF type:complete len:7500 (+),score=2428.07 TRINITY_DN227_c0_g2_i1:177-22676(+)
MGSPQRHPLTAALPAAVALVICMLVLSATSVDAACETSCAPGTFYASSNDTCIQCNAGYHCAGNSSAPVACSPGTASAAVGQSSSSTCTACAAGTYASTAGSTTCDPCPAGYSCTASAATLCTNSGDYSPLGSATCDPCPLGMYCPTVFAAVDCPDGFYRSSTGGSTCTICPSGKQCMDKTVAPVDCPAGTFSPSGQTNCTQCPTGHYSTGNAGSCTQCTDGDQCSNPAVAPVACPAGTYAGTGATSCTPCPDGTYNTGTGNNGCSNCPAGKSCLAPGSAPVDCPAGTYSPTGQMNCTQCASGFFSAGNAGSCSPCTAGNECSDPTSPAACPAGTFSNAQATTCTSCPEGTYSTGTGNTGCTPCPAGQQCIDTKSTAGCPAGTFSVLYQTNCTTCPAGTYQSSSNQASCQTCPSGSQCTNPTTATQCLAGTFNPAGSSSACQTCADGFVQHLPGQGSCYQCPPGYSCSDKASLPTQCPAGQYSPAGVLGCLTCPSGTTTVNGTAAANCQPCPAGSSCLDPLNPVTCPDGFYSSGSGAALNCTACPTGYTSNPSKTGCVGCPAGSSCGTPATPQTCPAGTYSIGGNVIACTPCPPGQQCPNADSTPISCPVGTYSLGSTTNCTVCPAGSACANPSSAPSSCPLGTYSLGSATTCTPCPPGFECASNNVAPVSCPDGQYSTGNATACSLCSAGFACYSKGLPPVSCPAGYYSLAGNNTCTVCPRGYRCPSLGMPPLPCDAGQYSVAGSTNCTNCPPGSECPTPETFPITCTPGTFSIGLQTNCTDCPPGASCPFTSADIQQPCPSGSYSLGQATSCTPCPAGYACPFPDRAVQNPCPSGSYAFAHSHNCTDCPAGWECPSPTGSLNQQCPPGTFAEEKYGNCITCPAGSRCPFTNKATIIPCNPGSYSSSNQTTCTLCPAGQACPNTDGTGITNCVPGTYSVGGQATCTQCTPGYYCPAGSEGTGVQTPCAPGEYSGVGDIVCQPCAAGRECFLPTNPGTACQPGYYSLGGARNCTQCPPGFECSDPSIPPNPCPLGYYSIGRAVICTPCTPGYICPQGSTTPTPAGQECPPGSYCNPATAATLCPAGTFGNSSAAADVTACIQCLPGKFCPLGTVNPNNNDCPMGHYCPAGTRFGTEFPCDLVSGLATYNDELGKVRIEDCKVCQPGNFCPRGSATGTECVWGSYCPQGTQNPVPCPGGTYSGPVYGLKFSNECIACPTGNYCPAGSYNPLQCQPGTYNPDPSSALSGNCRPCDAGMACDTPGLSSPNKNCAMGHFCPNGTLTVNQNPCPPGTVNDKTNMFQVEQCEACPGRFWCGWATGGASNPPTTCPAGFYCPPGTSYPNQYPCPPGSYSNRTGLINATECTTCPPGSYCAGIGETTPSGACSAGYYCPAGTGVSTANPCPAGTWTDQTNLYDASQCFPCSPGNWCPQASASETPCPPGTYVEFNNTGTAPTSTAGLGVDADQCKRCPAGSYCPSGSPLPLDCGTGKYSDVGLGTPCPDCQVGHYCNSTTTAQSVMLASRCEAGTYCPPGMKLRPDFLNNPCPVGQYCEEATPAPADCPVGTYNPSLGRGALSDCLDCPPGSYCLQKSVNVTGPCDPGHYCPARSYGPQQFPCPTTTYRALPGGEKLEDCVPCQYGRYCGQASVIGTVCPRGYYCLVGVDTPEPCPIGTFGNSTGLRQVEECTDCPPGRYCDGSGLPNPRGPCDPGYYCSGRAFTSAPPGPPTGGLCPPGGYCPVGSSVPTACSPGTFNNFTGGRTQLDCSFCTPGFYCAGSNNPFPTGPCDAGFYCTLSAQDPTGTGAGGITPAGTYTVPGSPAPIPCEPGTYAPTVGSKNKCRDCIPKFHCPFPGATNQTVCPAGSYCPLGTASAIKCPTGTYSNQIGQDNITACLDCPPGRYCDAEGLTAPAGDCSPGFYCIGRVDTPTPFNLALQFGALCPKGRYCVGQNGPLPPKCPAGTFNPLEGVTNITACTTCPEGMYCTNAAVPEAPTGPCAPGYFCNTGSITSTPSGGTPVTHGGPSGSGGLCPTGYYCPSPVSTGTYGPVGTYSPIPCPGGTTANRTGLAACDGCPAGYYCPIGNVIPIPCPSGKYCPGNSSLPENCPKGTFNNGTLLTSASDCTDCPGGRYCASVGLTYPTGLCLAGTFCTSKNTYPDGDNGKGDGTGVGGTCPVGRYCPAGTTVPQPCPIGTIGGAGVTGLTQTSECQPCTPGFYCSDMGRETPNGPCAAGHYCALSASVAAPVGGCAGPNGQGDACPAGKYCPVGSAQPLGCAPGTWQPNTGNDTCFDCPVGYYCPANSTTINNCPEGYYCPQRTGGAFDNACPPGTYGNRTNLGAQSECNPCPPGKYCVGPGAVTPTGECDPGYYCILNAALAQPVDPAQGGPCSKGAYCPAGSSYPLPCPPGQYCGSDTLSAPSGPCAPGYYCVGNATVASPPNDVTGGICPPGFYCPNGTDANLPSCPKGTFNANPGMWSIDNCTLCTPGQFCGTANLTSPSGPCEKGYYCTIGAETPTPVDGVQGAVCPVRNRCPGGDDTPQLCAPGTYQPSTANDTCITCPAGSYCLSNETLPITCPPGSYCPPGTGHPYQYLCPNGTYSSGSGLERIDQCTDCPPGKYCEGMGQTAVTGDCDPGYYCVLAARYARPAPDATGGPCFPGTYCPGGASNYTICDPGMYCDAWTLSTPSGNCSAGYYCLQGAVQAAPNVTEQGGACPPGYYCPVGSPSFTLKCPQGTFNGQYGQASITDCQQCPGGKVCSTDGLIAPNGDCAPGYFCSIGAQSSKPLAAQVSAMAGPGSNQSQGDICPTGHYCPGGTAVPLGCAPGTYQDSQGNHTCFDCPAGSACVANTTIPTTCPPGFYCPLNTVAPNAQACPQGTYNPVPGASNITACLDCTAGYYCNNTGLSAVVGKCAPGYYCSGRSPTRTPPASAGYGGQCSAGHYCPEGSHQEVPCDAGKYCLTTLLSLPSGPCAPGHYCTARASTPTPTDGTTGNVCPPGYVCPLGTDNFTIPCPTGTFRSTAQAANDSQCTDCTPGFYCNGPGLTAVSGVCAPGYYCTLGAVSATPMAAQLNRLATSQGDICPVGHYCPANSDSPLPCPAGTFQNAQGNDTCMECPEGFYCPQTSSTLIACPPGSYCPAGTKNATQFLCPAGTFNPSTNRKQLSDCLQCTPGSYCATPGLANVTGLCNGGWYCSGGARSPEPAPATNTGGFCVAGYYCPVGSINMTLCTVGEYCMNDKQATTNGLCQAGFYCSGGAKVANPTPAGPTGGPCPVGYYCPFGFAAPQPCPDGTYSNVSGILAKASCTPCDGGSYCLGAARTAPNDQCDPGYYCTLGSKLKTPLGQLNHLNTSQGDICPSGRYCPRGTPYPLGCPAGTYAPSTGFAVCKGCPAGYFCLENTTTPAICPQGFYCPENTTSSTSFPCQNGTYGNTTGLSKNSECRPCDPGKFCSGFGLTAPVGNCAPGYICYTKARVPNPNDGVEGIRCPAGSYCGAGDTAPTTCNAGYWNPLTGQDQVADCQKCPRGYACNSTGISDLSDYVCPTGYYCEGGVSLNPPQTVDPQGGRGDVCPPGYKCPAGAEYTQECAAGTYAPNTGQSACTPCLQRNYCPRANMTSDDLIFCPPGYYCPAGSDFPVPCPAGTYNPNFGMGTLAECTDCPTGFYCSQSNATTPTGPCSPGYYCETKATQSQPAGSACNKKTASPPLDPACNGICPAGYYCPNSTAEPVPCNPGYYNPNVGGTNIDVCVPCTAGSYCASAGLSAPDGPCNPGFYCNGGPSGTSPTGNPCPPGFRCPTGTAVPIACDETTYQPSSGQPACIDCPAGSWCARCEINTNCTANSTVAKVCPLGYYCPAKTDHPVVCPPGTYGTQTGLDNATQCEVCPAGKYCTDGKTPKDCAPGFVCLQGNRYPDPSDGFHYEADGVTFVLNAAAFPANRDANNNADPTARVNGYPCPTGFYCPAGTSVPTPCASGTVRTLIGGIQQADCTLCPAGFKCFDNNAVACTKGEYCPFGQTPAFCPKGTYGPTVRATAVEDCLTCPAGYNCNATGLGDYKDLFCPLGFYCPGDRAQPDPVPCKPGTFRASNAVLGKAQSDCSVCPAGTFCPCTTKDFCPSDPLGVKVCQIGAVTSKQCPGGYYCPAESDAPIACPARTYCPPGAKNTTACPPGFYCPERTVAPRTCPAGSYCPAESGDKQLCPGGYKCTENTTVPVPCVGGVSCPPGCGVSKDFVCDQPCPSGFYCPPTTAYPLACPAGTKAAFDQATTSTAGIVTTVTSTGGGTNRSSIANSCIACPAGYAGEHPTRQNCTICEAGFVCLTGGGHSTRPLNISQNGYPCPAGHYCPAGSSVQTPCPAGTYRDTTGGSALSSCTPCPAGSFNAQPGATACVPCGASAFSEIGASQCSCNGTNRAFQPSDGSCRCKTGYRFLNDKFQEEDGDDPRDCQPIVYDRCSNANEFRNLDTGKCEPRSPNFVAEKCRKQCQSASNPNGEGTYYEEADFCECADIKDTNDVCDVNCQRNELVLKFIPTDPDFLYLVFPDGSQKKYDIKSVPTFAGSFSGCTTAVKECTIKIVQSTNDGHAASFGLTSDYFDSLILGTTSTRRRLLQTTATTSQVVNQPMVCIKEGESVVWDVSSGADNYPVYVKDSLYNTNPDFDDGEFRRLATRKLNANTSISFFAHSFNQAGTYVFVNNNQRDRRMFVTVVLQNERCATESGVQPITSQNLVTMGVSKDRSIILSPDYLLIGLLLGALCLIVGLVIWMFWYVRKKSWANSQAAGIQYRRLGQAHEFGQYASKGSTVSKRMKFKNDGEVDMEAYRDNFWDYERQVDLEGFNVKTLYDKLEDQTIHVTSQLAEHKEHVRAFFDKISAQTELLGSLLDNKLGEVADAAAWGAGAAGGVDDLRSPEERKAAAEAKKSHMKQYEAILKEERENLEADERAREQYDNDQQGVVDEVEHLNANLLSELKSLMANPSDESHRRAVDQISQVIESKMAAVSGKRTDEAGRRGVATSQDDVVGCFILDPVSNSPVPLHRLTDERGNLKDVAGLIHKDSKTGLFVPEANLKMQRLDTGEVLPIPNDYVVHPRTGLVVPMAGHVACDKNGVLKLADTMNDEPLPYVKAPEKETFFRDPKTGDIKPPAIQMLRGIAKDTALVAGAKMLDPATGKMVPILGVTVDPMTNQPVPVGGTMTHPITGELVPIELDAPMLDPATGEIVPITGIAIDGETGQVVPVGGKAVNADGEMKPIMAGFKALDETSGKPRVITGATVDVDGNVIAATQGGFAVPDNGELAAEQVYHQALADMRDVIRDSLEDLKRTEAEYNEKIANAANLTTAQRASLEAQHQMDLSNLRLDMDDAVDDQQEIIKEALAALDSAREKNRVARAKRRNRLRIKDQQNRKIVARGGRPADPQAVAPNAEALLQQEINARADAQRRQKNLQNEADDLQHEINEILREAAGGELTEDQREEVLSLQKQLGDVLSDLQDSTNAEAQRRIRAHNNLKGKVSDEVLEELTSNDQTEKAAVDKFVEAKKRGATAIEKVLKKIQDQEDYYHEHMAELRAQGNPDAIEAFERHHAEVMKGLYQELNDQIKKANGESRATEADMNMAKEQARLQREDAADILRSQTDSAAASAAKQSGPGAMNPSLQALARANPDMAMLLKGLVGGGGAQVDPSTNLLVPAGEPSPEAQAIAATMVPLPGETEEEMVARMLAEAGDDVNKRNAIMEAQRLRQQEALAAKLAARQAREETSQEAQQIADEMKPRRGETEEEMMVRMLGEAGDDEEKKKAILEAQKLRQQEALAAKIAARKNNKNADAAVAEAKAEASPEVVQLSQQMDNEVRPGETEEEMMLRLLDQAGNDTSKKQKVLEAQKLRQQEALAAKIAARKKKGGKPAAAPGAASAQESTVDLPEHAQAQLDAATKATPLPGETEEQMRARLINEAGDDERRRVEILEQQKMRQAKLLEDKLAEKRAKAAARAAKEAVEVNDKTTVKELEEAQQHEAEALMKELEEEVDLELEALETRVDLDQQAKVERKKAEMKQALADPTLDAAERERIQREFENELKNLEANQWNEKQRQKQELARKLEERKRKRLNAQALKHAQAHKQVAIQEASVDEARDILAEEQEKERKAQEAALAAEAEAEAHRLEEQLEHQEDDVIEEAKARHARALAALDPNASQEERERLEREFADELARLNSIMDNEKARQKSTLEEKIAARKARKQKEQQARQEREQRELLMQKQQHEERKKLQEQQEKEQAALDAEIEAEIERELQAAGVKVTPQVKEEIQQDKEREKQAVKLEKAKQKIEDDPTLTSAERERLLKEFDSEIATLNASMSSEKERQRKALRDKVAAKKAARAAEIARKQELEAQQIAAKQKAEAAKLEAKIAEELAADLEKAVDEEVEREVQAEVKQLEESTEKDLEFEKEKLEREHQDKLQQAEAANPNMTAEERERLTREHEEELKRLEETLGNSKARQEADLKRKIEERRQKKLEKQKRAAAAADLEAVVPEVELPTGPTAEELALIAEQERQQRELEARQAEEKKALEEAAAAEAREAEARQAAEMEKEKKRILHERQQQNAAELAAMQNLSDAEKARIVDEHKRELAQLEGTLDNERARQQKAMKEKLAARKAAKAKALARKQDKEKQRDLSAQEKEKAELESKIIAQAETKAIEKAKAVVSEDQVEDAVALVLQKRHEKELQELTARHVKEKANAVSDAIAKINDTLDEERDALVAKHVEEETEFELNSANVDPEDLEEDRKTLKNKQQAEIAALEAKANADKEYAQKNALRETEGRHAYELLGMRERHAREIISRSEESSPEDILRRQQGFEAERAAEEIASFKEQMEREKKERLEKLKAERRAYEEKKKKEMEEELHKFEEQLRLEEERDKERAAKRMEELEHRKTALMEEREKKQQEELEAMGNVDQQQREKILEEHTHELKNLENALDTERERQQQKLKEKLEKQRELKRQRKLQKEQDKLKMSLKEREAAAKAEKAALEAKAREDKQKLKQAQAKAEEQAQKQKEDSERAAQAERQARQEEERRQQEAAQEAAQAAQLQQQQAMAAQVAPAAAAPVAAGTTPSAGLVAALADTRSDAEWLDLLTKSPLMAKLRQIEDMLRSGDLKVGQVSGGDAKSSDSSAAGASAPVASGEAFLDARDASWSPEGALEVIEVNDLSAINFVVYKFGLHILDILTVQSHASVNLLIAKSLPATNYARNAFKNSFYYEDSTKTLFLREQRVQSAGDFILVLVHALSHVKCRSFDDDTNPAFLREFYKNLRTVCSELFFAKSKRDTSLPSAQQTPSAVEGMFGRLPASERSDFVKDLMDMQHETDPSDEYSRGSLVERLESYGGLTMNAQLKDYLSKLEENVASGKSDALEEQRRALEEKTKKGKKSGESEASKLKAHITDLEDQVDSLTNENMKQIMEVNKLKQSTRALVGKLQKASAELDAATEGTPEHAEVSGRVQELTTQIGKAKTALRRSNTLKENTHKRLQSIKDELDEAQKKLSQL